jgi:phosphoadenosine phosphosulfate reductase
MEERVTEDLDLDGLIEHSIQLLREHEPPEGYYGCFSGGKDSVALKFLAEAAMVKVDWHYNVTTIDPPELVRFIRGEHTDVTFERPRHGNFFRRAAFKKGLPTRRARWCCEEYKEGRNPKGRLLLMGIRAEESPRRAKAWEELHPHWRRRVMVLSPMLQWGSDELWEYIHGEKIPYSELYDEGFHRLGCVGCPLASEKNRLKEFARWPKFEEKWKWALRMTWERRAGTMQINGREWFGSAIFDNWEDMWEWWVHDVALPKKGKP